MPKLRREQIGPMARTVYYSWDEPALADVERWAPSGVEAPAELDARGEPVGV